MRESELGRAGGEEAERGCGREAGAARGGGHGGRGGGGGGAVVQ